MDLPIFTVHHYNSWRRAQPLTTNHQRPWSSPTSSKSHYGHYAKPGNAVSPAQQVSRSLSQSTHLWLFTLRGVALQTIMMFGLWIFLVQLFRGAAFDIASQDPNLDPGFGLQKSTQSNAGTVDSSVISRLAKSAAPKKHGSKSG